MPQPLEEGMVMNGRKVLSEALMSLGFFLMTAGWFVPIAYCSLNLLASTKDVVMPPPTLQAASGQQSTTAAPTESAMHSVTVTFDYDFTKTPACSDKVKTKCVAKFSVYDISGVKPIFLFSLPVPAGSKGSVKGITATSPRMAFVVGKHRIGVAAQTPDGKESPLLECKAIIEIKSPGAGPSASH